MKLARGQAGGEIVFGCVEEDRIIDLSSAFADMASLLKASQQTDGRGQILDLSTRAPSFALGETQLLPPIARPERILCVGTNYYSHVDESDRVDNAPDHPMIFTRFPSSLVGQDEAIVRPRISADFDYEGELAVVIGAETSRVDAASAMAAVAGYSCFLDGTLRDYQRHTSQFTPGKNFDRSGAWGPWIVTADDVEDPHRLTLETILNGETVQSASTAQMIFSIGEIISYCSTFTTLQPGDVIATGTPGGVGYARTPPLWLRPDSRISVRLSGIGTLTNDVVDEHDDRP